MVLTARLPDLQDITHWKVPAVGAHGLEIDHRGGRLYVACDDATLVEIDAGSGKVSNQWPIAGAPDVTFFNPTTGSRSRRHRQAGTDPIDRSPQRRQHTNDDGSGGSHNGLGAAGPALRVFTIGRRSHCPL